MESREEWVERAKTRLDEWNAQLDELEAKARAAREERRAQYERLVSTLRRYRDDAREKLSEIQQGGDTAWAEAREGLQKSWTTLSDSFRDAIEEFSAARQVVRIGPFKDLIASGVRAGSLVTLSGQVSVDGEGNVVGAGDIAAQIRQCYANVREVLSEFGASMDHIVDEMWLVTDVQDVMAKLDPIFAIRSEVYGKNPDVTQTLVEVSALVMPELLIEIKCVARV